MHDTWPDPVLDDDWHITAFHAGMKLPASIFAAPPSNSNVAVAAARLPLTADITDHAYIIVRVMVGDRGLDFELDSSSPNSFIDRDIAAELNLPTFGHATKLSNGKPLGYDTVIPEAKIGPIALHNFNVWATDISFNPDPKIKVVGVLGYDFLANNEIHVDFVNGLVETFPQNQFSGPAPIKDSLDIPLTLDNGVPFVPMDIGDGFTENVVLDTDFEYTVVFGPYLDAHGDSFQDLQKNRHEETDVPFADEGSFGQKAEVWWSETPELRFAIANYQHLPILTTNFPYTRSGKSVDAMLGLDYLHFFDLYFDFPHQRLLLVPNKWFFETFKKNA